MGIRADFLNEIEEFIEKYGMTATSFGLTFKNSPNFVFDLRKGRKPTTDTVDEIRAHMDAYKDGAR